MNTKSSSMVLITVLLISQVSLSSGIIWKLNRLSETMTALLEQRTTGQTSQAPQYIEDVSTDDDPIWGEQDAPVTIVEFADYECPFCAQNSQNMRSILSDYSTEVKYVMRDFPLQFHPNAFKAAEAANCAGEQDKYWEMHDILFSNQEELDVLNLKSYAAELQINMEEFETCFDGGKYVDEIRQDMEDGRRYQVEGTPTLFVNGHRLAGPSPDQIRQTIELALKEAEE